ncbi:WD repeat-containing protein 8 [Sistotremastrum niveocremeum HHB9708]|uniref:WD repeat-containing protein 8 n=1 Tax=Sistotremastrum niveocremeum HHB9708 TaxID=1314777 RepID=A0A164UDP0_9AGAM|nr:WD repeat-containing protein 8 [Sistotremastrum niveocremeum HHB9708]
MDFTPIHEQSSSLVEFSPGSHFLLTAIRTRLVVRRSENLEISRVWEEPPSDSPPPSTSRDRQSSAGPDAWITHIGWSCDSEFILAAFAKKGVVNVHKMRDESWKATIEAGVEGLSRAVWAPDGRHILCFSEWGLRVTIWSLTTGGATYIQYPLHPERGWCFRKDGRYLLVAERVNSKDTLGIYDSSKGYQLARQFSLPTSSLSSLSISPRGNHVAAWENALEYRLFILTLTGHVVATFTPDHDAGLGIRTVSWHPGGSFLAVGGWEEKIYILNNVTWTPVAEIDLQARIPAGINIWRERFVSLDRSQSVGFLPYERLQTGVVPFVRRETGKPHPRTGVIQLDWNVDGTLLLVRLENAPTSIYILHFPGPEEEFDPRLRSVLLHSQSILYAHWNPVRPGVLGISCGTGGLYTWSNEWMNDEGEEDEMAECVKIPADNFQVRDIKWSPDGKTMVLLDKTDFCCAAEVKEE